MWARRSGAFPPRAPQIRPPTPLAADHAASSTPASSFEPSASLKAGSTTSSVPKAKPTGRLASTSVRRPGDASAPRPRAGRPASVASGPGLPARPASIQEVPSSTQPADTISAYWGPTVATTSVVSSGPITKTISIITESSANAPASSSGRPGRR